jgi:hypothetical protein
MDEIGRGSTSPTVAQGRRKDKQSYPGPQEEEEYNFHHRARQRGAGYEETIRRTHHCADAEKGAPGSNGTIPGASSIGHCTG